ncbi:MAG TPA: hypothetical protein VLE43_20070 [Candidatus Saccharimonadia bacterium]|nr:hypothetical protein [Candidatus Saccharimonadia bacterium]
MTDDSKPPVIRMNEPITLDDWEKGREARRLSGLKVAPASIRRKESSSDKRLRAAFGGNRAPVPDQTGEAGQSEG